MVSGGARTPLLVRLPGQTERKDIDAFVQTIDLPATMLDLAGVPSDDVHGKGLLPLIEGKADKLRDIAISAYPLKFGTPRNCKSMIRDERWSLLYSGTVIDPDGELEVPSLACGAGPDDYQLGDHSARLYDVQADPDQKQNVIEENLDVAKELHAKYVAFLREMGTPAEFLAVHEEFAVKP